MKITNFYKHLWVITIFKLRVTYRLNMIGFGDDYVVHVEYVVDRPVVRDLERQRIVHIDNDE